MESEDVLVNTYQTKME